MAYDTFTLTGTYNTWDGQPYSHYVKVIPSVPIVIDAAGNKILAGHVKITLDETGSFEVDLPDPNDPSLNPSGFGYTVAARLRDTHLDAVSFAVPEGTVTLDMADVTTVDPSTFSPGVTYAPAADVVAVAADVAAVEADVLAVEESVAKAKLGPGPLAGVVQAVAGTTPRPTDKFGGYVWGHQGGNIKRSADGIAWTTYCPTPSGAEVARIIPTDDGEVVVATSTTVRKSTGWAGGTPTWTTKITANGLATFQGFNVDGDGTKFIASQYGERPDSRYAHISTDGGDTWTLVWDSVAKFGAPAADVSHLHGCCYDPWSDRFYLAEGHSDGGDIAGIYYSEDDGATWTRPVGMIQNPSPTVIVATDDGLCCGADDEAAGLYGVLRQDDPDLEAIRQTWMWHSGVQGVVGFGTRGWRDPVDGLVYVGFYTSNAAAPMIIAAGTASVAGLVYTWTGVVAPGDQINEVVTVGDLVIGSALVGGVRQSITAKKAPRVSSVLDRGGVFGGTTVDGTGSAMGVGSSAAVQAAAIGPASSAVLNGVAIGWGAKSAGTQGSTAIGRQAKAGQFSVVIGDGVDGESRQNSVAVGTALTLSGNNLIAVGRNITVGAAAYGIGVDGTASGTFGIGLGSQFGVTHARSVSFGNGTDGACDSTGADQMAFGPRQLMLKEIAATPADLPPLDGLQLYARDNGSGKTRLIVRFRDGSEQQLAIQP